MTNDYSSITLLIDMDDTIENLLSAWIKWLNDKHGTSVKPEDILSWDLKPFFPSLSNNAINEPLYIDKFWETVQPREDAIKYLPRIYEMGFKPYICTSSIYHTIRKKFDCILGNYFPYIPWENIITITKKQLINADILIDDGIHNLIGGSYKKILITAHHNKSFDTRGTDIVRVNDWQEAYDKIIEYADEILADKQEA